MSGAKKIKNGSIEPPRAEKRPLDITVHGDTRSDPYAWLQNREDPAVRTHLEAENAYADRLLKKYDRLRKELYREMKGRMKEDDLSVPVKQGPYLYYSRVRKGKQYQLHYRKPAVGGSGRCILDENALAKGHDFFSLGAFEVSTDHNLLAYTTDTSGSENYTLFIKDLRTGRLHADEIPSVDSVVWAEDGLHLFYTREEHPYPPRKVFRHRLGTPHEEDVLVYEEEDPKWFVGIGKSRSREYIFFHSSTFDSSEVRWVTARTPLEPVRLFLRRKNGVRYGIEHHADFFYMTTNERAINYKILRAPINNPTKRNWDVWLPHDEKRAIVGFTPFRTFVVLSVREKGSEELYVTTEHAHSRVRLPENEHSVMLWDDTEYDTYTVRFTYGSFLTPKTVFDYDVRAKKLRTRKKQEVPGWDKKRYVSRRVWVRSNGVSVPVVLVHKKGIRQDGSNPLFLEAYGSYGVSNDPYFSITKASLLERGFVIALAHPRGGGEMGWQWHKQAKLLTKHNTYRDVVAVAEYLVRRKYTSPERMALVGGSAGGMMVGAVLNMRPDLFGAALAYVPAADLLTSSLDETLGGTRLHYDETGDPRKPSHYFYLKKWSPYENVRSLHYPALLIRASFNDIRTPYWEAAKWAARLREMKTGEAPILLKTELSAGHFGKSGRYEGLKERAYDFAFLIRALRA